MRTFALALDIGQARLVIEALAELPFKTVYELIGRLNSQANDGDADGAAGRYAVSTADLALILGALGQLPYQRVYQLMAALQAQVGHLQVEGA